MYTFDQPRLIEGGLYVDTRGTVAYVNDFDFKGVDRFYTIRSHRANDPRGWVGHRQAQKWFSVIQGTVLIAAVKPDVWWSPARDLSVERFVLSATKPHVLHVPAGYATGIIMLDAEALLMVFSSGQIENAGDDDYRFPIDTWSISPVD